MDGAGLLALSMIRKFNWNGQCFCDFFAFPNENKKEPNSIHVLFENLRPRS